MNQPLEFGGISALNLPPEPPIMDGTDNLVFAPSFSDLYLPKRPGRL
jgi:hypothetical protein